MISINATLILQVIQFLILVYVMNHLLFRPILKISRERSEHLKKKADEIEQISLEAERLRKELLARELDTRKQASKERIGLRSDGLIQVEGYLEKSQTQVVSIRSEADKEVSDQIAKAEPNLKGEAVSLADQIIERVIGRRIAA
jgi:F-type H+-transporting ATPase subunit b